MWKIFYGSFCGFGFFFSVVTDLWWRILRVVENLTRVLCEAWDRVWNGNFNMIFL
jgi:hypothetical protein